MILEKYHNPELVLRRTQMFMAATKLKKIMKYGQTRGAGRGGIDIDN